MPPTLIGRILLAVIGVVAVYKGLVWTVPIAYESFKPQMLRNIAVRIVTKDLCNNEIYTKDGEIRSNIIKKIDSKETELNDLHDKEEKYIKKYLYNKKAINKYGNTRKIKQIRLENALYSYMVYDRNYIYKDMESDILVNGLTPEQFLDMRHTVKGDKVGVYVIYNIDKKMYYVGQAKRLYFRVWQHFTGHGNGDIYADYKYNNRFIIRFILLNESGYTDLDMLEKDMIQYYNAFTNGYNKTIGNTSRTYRSL